MPPISVSTSIPTPPRRDKDSHLAHVGRAYSGTRQNRAEDLCEKDIRGGILERALRSTFESGDCVLPKHVIRDRDRLDIICGWFLVEFQARVAHRISTTDRIQEVCVLAVGLWPL